MKKLQYLEGLRGVAALIVVLNHFVVAFYPALHTGNINEVHTTNAYEIVISRSPLNLFYNGNFAVCIFFILSGYVLSYKFLKTYEYQVIFSSAVKRYFRLLVPVLASNVLIYMVMIFSLFYNKEAGIISRSTWWLSTFWNFDTSFSDVITNTFHEVFFDYSAKYNTVLWTMTYELFGSFLVFGILLLVSITKTTKYRCVIYIIFIYFFMDSYYLAFILGVILCDLQNATNVKGVLHHTLVQIFCLLLGLYLGSYPTAVSVEDSLYEYLVLTKLNSALFYHIIGAFLIMITFVYNKNLKKIFSRRFFGHLGEISFSLYLTHIIVLGSFSSFIFIHFSHTFPYLLSVVLTVLSSIPIMYLIAYLLFTFIDTKAVVFSNFVSKIIFNSITKLINNKR